MITPGGVIAHAIRGDLLSTLLLVVVGMLVAMALLVLYSSHLFEENRTRVTRRQTAATHPAAPETGELEWCTLVDPTEARNRAQASAPFARAYARAMAGEDDTRAA